MQFPSRSTWACELKCIFDFIKSKLLRHAPRERVSWNPYYPPQDKEGEKSRSTWACELKWHLCLSPISVLKVTLHVSVWVEICKWLHGVLFSNRHAPRERVSWNSLTVWFLFLLDSHAPRERVSWNKELSMWVNKLMVTLHVSVWVEMSLCLLILLCWTSRSTWACELKYTLRKFYRLNVGHAPRERVSWNLGN